MQASSTRWLALGGLAIGWLAGLSVSPILETVLAPIIVLAATATAALSGIYSRNSDKPIVANAKPLGILLVCIALGSTSGLFARHTSPAFIAASMENVATVPKTSFGLHNSDTTPRPITGNPQELARVASVALEALDRDITSQTILGAEYTRLRNRLISFRDNRMQETFSSETLEILTVSIEKGETLDELRLPPEIIFSLKYALGERLD